MIVELTRFKVKSGKSKKVDEWLEFLNENMKGVLLTLEREKMYVESIFREEIEGEEYLYWFSIQGEGGEDVTTSEHEIDKKHIEYWKECIDRRYEAKDLTPEVVMLPEKIIRAME